MGRHWSGVSVRLNGSDFYICNGMRSLEITWRENNLAGMQELPNNGIVSFSFLPGIQFNCTGEPILEITTTQDQSTINNELVQKGVKVFWKNISGKSEG
jgi:hypothetical protein